MTQMTSEQGSAPWEPEARGGAESVTLIDGIKAHKWIVLLSGLLMGALVAAFGWVTAPGAVARGELGLVYPATGNVLLPAPSGDATMARFTAQRALFATSDEVLSTVADSQPGVSLDSLRRVVAVTPSKTGNAIAFTTTADTPEEAVKLTQAVMNAYRSATAADVAARSEAEARSWEARGDEAQANQVRLDGKAYGDGVEFEVSPSLGSTQSKSLITRETILGVLLGLGLGALLAWAIEDGRRRKVAAVGAPRGPAPPA